MTRAQKLIVVSNRLPITLEERADGIEAQPSSGGLVSALLPIFREMGGVWVGWPGITDYTPRLAEVLREECRPEYSLEPVHLTAKERALFYQGCANEVIWPLFHDLQSRCRFDPAFWETYGEANVKFADATQTVATDGDFIWVHDYHLMSVGRILRERGLRSTVAYFHHIPFPSPDIFEKIPWRREIIGDLLSFDTIGFQTDRDRRNFVACAKRELTAVRLHRSGTNYFAETSMGRTQLGAFPISVDYKSLSKAVSSEKVRERKEKISRGHDGRRVILGIDRLDYTKGIPERLLGYATFLKKNPEFRDKVTLIQVVVPSREEIQNYSELRATIERRISEINGEYGSPEWCPITYLYKALSPEDLLGLYAAADVMLVTPLKDGMNLVAKEYCAAQNDDSGVLILSEFAGAAAELRAGALLVNPYDSEAMSAAIREALAMDRGRAQWRMRRMRRLIEANDVFKWCNDFLEAANCELVFNDAERETLERSHFTARAI